MCNPIVLTEGEKSAAEAEEKLIKLEDIFGALLTETQKKIFGQIISAETIVHFTELTPNGVWMRNKELSELEKLLIPA